MCFLVTRQIFAPFQCILCFLVRNFIPVSFLTKKVCVMNPLQQRHSKVNGKFLQQHTGKQVSLLGEVLKSNPSSNTFEIKTTDNCMVNVIMNEPFDENLEGWIEVRGVGQGKNVILGRHYILLPEEMFKDFDRQLYDDVITVINTFNNPWVNAD